MTRLRINLEAKGGGGVYLYRERERECQWPQRREWSERFVWEEDKTEEDFGSPSTHLACCVATRDHWFGLHITEPNRTDLSFIGIKLGLWEYGLYKAQ